MKRCRKGWDADWMGSEGRVKEGKERKEKRKKCTGVKKMRMCMGW